MEGNEIRDLRTGDEINVVVSDSFGYTIEVVDWIRRDGEIFLRYRVEGEILKIPRWMAYLHAADDGWKLVKEDNHSHSRGTTQHIKPPEEDPNSVMEGKGPRGP